MNIKIRPNSTNKDCLTITWTFPSDALYKKTSPIIESKDIDINKYGSKYILVFDIFFISIIFY